MFKVSRIVLRIIPATILASTAPIKNRNGKYTTKSAERFKMTDCLLISSFLRSVRASASHFSPAQQAAASRKSVAPSTTTKSSAVNATHRRGQVAENGRNSSRRDTDVKSVDDVELAMRDADVIALPEILADFKTQLSTLQDEIHNDYAEIERLRVENEELQKRLESRDAIIEALRAQLEASGKI